jgi:predicted amidohydrolase
MQDLRIAAVQMRCRVGEVDDNLETIRRIAASAAQRDVEIACFPELCVCGYNAGDLSTPNPERLDGSSVAALSAIAGEHDIMLSAGLLELDRSGIIYNTQVVCAPSGLIGSYRKTHVPTSEIGTFRPGSELPVFDHRKIRFGLEICYDTHFPEVSCNLAERGAELIFMPHASSDESPDEKLNRWLRYVPARACDNAVFVAICNQVGDNGMGRTFPGVTFICDPSGAVIAQASTSDEEMVVADLSAADLGAPRTSMDHFYRHFRRPEIYARWQRQ